MGKYFFLALCSLALFACSDGDLQIETIDFDSVSLQYCTAPVTTSKNILFKINDNEALILELQSGVLNKGVVGDPLSRKVPCPANPRLPIVFFRTK